MLFAVAHVPAVVSFRSGVLRSFLSHPFLAAFSHFVTPRKSNVLNLLHLAPSFVIAQSGSSQPTISHNHAPLFLRYSNLIYKATVFAPGIASFLALLIVP
jgi:hypothetical protein